MMQAMASQLSASPSFNSYSSETLAEIAARVLSEFQIDPLAISDDDVLFDSRESQDSNQQRHDADSLEHQNPHDDVPCGEAEDDEDFEFAFVSRDANSSPVSADDIFCNGQIKPMYPIFDRNLLFAHPHFAPSNDVVSADASASPISTPTEAAPVRRHRLPLRKLMFEERETVRSSSSASDAEDSDIGGVAPETYCPWSPKSASAGRPCKKSTSTGSSSKRWKLRDLLLRSGSQSSGRKEAMVFLSQSKRSNKVAQEVSKPSSGGGEAPYYVRKGTAKEGEQMKKKSFLPYRHELVGIFANVNGVGRNLHPF